MNSCLYECRVMHARLAPRRHRFVYRIFFFALELDELPELARRVPFFSLERRNLYSFRQEDFLPAPEPDAPGRASLRERVIAHLTQQGVHTPVGRIVLVALPRVAGYVFNPVAFYFCFGAEGAPVAAIAEVTNTFRERKAYVLGRETWRERDGGFRLRVPKHFYVSPFSEVDVAFDFRLRVPTGRLSIQIDDHAAGARTLTSTLQGVRRELTGARLAWFALKYPLVTLGVIARIHWQALRLWLKRVPWFPKSARAAEQHPFHRPHSAAPTSPA